jgi:hypothetical protein
MSYEAYKVIHLAAVFTFLSASSVLLLARPQGVQWKVLTGLASLFILVAGFGLLAKMEHGAGMPLWVQAKLGIWLLMTGTGHLVAKRFPAQASKAFWVTLLLAIGSAAIAIMKPF